MPTRPFTQHYDPFDTGVKTMVGQVTTLGVLVLVVLDRLFPNKVARDRLEFIFGVDPKTLTKALTNLEIFGYASRSGSSKSELWIATTLGSQVIRQTGLAASTAASTLALALPTASVSQPAQPALPLFDSTVRLENGGENLSAARSSSSDRIDQSLIDQSIDLEEEETPENFSANPAQPSGGEISEPDRQAGVADWCQRHSVTGDKRRDVLADAFCTVARLEGWWLEMKQRESAGAIKFRTRFGPLNYAITCCLNHDEPPAPFAARVPNAEAESENFSVAAPAVSTVADPIADAHRRYPPIESRTWTYIRDELASDLKSVAARRICQALYPTRFDDERLQLVVVDPTGLLIARQFQTSIERMLKRDTDRAYTVEFVTL